MRDIMSIFFTVDQLEQEVRYLREQNQKILRELSTVIEENSVLKLNVCPRGVSDFCRRRGRRAVRKKGALTNEDIEG